MISLEIEIHWCARGGLASAAPERRVRGRAPGNRQGTGRGRAGHQRGAIAHAVSLSRCGVGAPALLAFAHPQRAPDRRADRQPRAGLTRSTPIKCASRCTGPGSGTMLPSLCRCPATLIRSLAWRARSVRELRPAHHARRAEFGSMVLSTLPLAVECNFLWGSPVYRANTTAPEVRRLLGLGERR